MKVSSPPSLDIELEAGNLSAQASHAHLSNSHTPFTPQSRQSAKLFLQSSELEASVPHPPPWFRGGGRALAGERGVGRVPIPTSGHMVHCGTLYINVLCDLHSYK